MYATGARRNQNQVADPSKDLKKAVANLLPDDKVESVVYPKYERTGELVQASEAFLGWYVITREALTELANSPRLKERVMDMRKKKSEKPWPANDRDVGVVLVAHSMGFVFHFIVILPHC